MTDTGRTNSRRTGAYTPADPALIAKFQRLLTGKQKGYAGTAWKELARVASEHYEPICSSCGELATRWGCESCEEVERRYDAAAEGDQAVRLSDYDEGRCPASDGTYGCTRDEGHVGQHVAEGTSRVLAVWVSS